MPLINGNITTISVPLINGKDIYGTLPKYK